MIILAMSPLPFLLTNLHEERSAVYVERLIKLDSKKTIAGLIILYDYYKAKGNDEKARRLGYMYHRDYPREIKCNKAFEAMDDGKLDLAISIINTIEPDRFDASYQRVLAKMHFLQGNYDLALRHIDWTIELRRYFSEVYRERAQIYLALNQHDRVFEDMRKAYQLNDSNMVILEGLTFIHTYYGQHDSCLYYAERMKIVDSSKPTAYYWLAKSYLSKNMLDSAAYYADECRLRAYQDTILAAGLTELIKQINGRRNKPATGLNR
jgi:tetratricopeptide (TPR) repeat protein